MQVQSNQVAGKASPLRAARERDRAKELARDAAVAIAARNPADFSLALQRFSSLIRRTAAVFFRSATDIDDLQQEVSLALFQRLHLLRDPGAIRPYIITVTSRLAQQQLRKLRSSQRVFGLATAAVEDPVAPVDIEAEHALNRAKTLLLRLREREREPFVLHLGGGMNLLEVAQATGMSVPTVRRRLKRAARRFSRLARRDLFVAHYLSGGL